MPRPRDPNRDLAKRLWLESGGRRTPNSIAEELGVPASTVRKWKCEDQWEKERPKKNGAPFGNQNAKGNIGGPGATPGNKRAVVTGEFESIFYDTLDDKERQMLEHTTHEKKQLLIHQINLLIVRERKMMVRLKELREGSAMLKKKERWDHEMAGADGIYFLKPTATVATVNEARDDRIVRIEEALTRVQAELRRCVDSLRQIDESELKYF